MNYTILLCSCLLSYSLTGCFGRTDRHPDMPLLPQVDNARIRVDSLPDTTVHGFIFSADKTKIYAIVLTASTGVFAQHTLVEFDQTGHRLRELPLGERSIQKTELALFQPTLLVWQSSNLFYRFDLDRFTIIDIVHTYSTGNYPAAQKDKDWESVDQESRAWFRQKQNEIGQQFDIQKTDSVTLAVLEGNKANTDAYWAAIQEARSQQMTQLEPDRHKAYYEQYAGRVIRSAKSSFGYRSPDGYAAYVFATVAPDSTVAFALDEESVKKLGSRFLTLDINPSLTKAQTSRSSLTEGRFILSEGQSLTDKTSRLALTEGIIAKHNDYLLGGSSPDEFLFYFDLKLGTETAHFKWLYPLGLANDFHLQSANGSVYVLKAGVLYWFHL